jgi:hypothetical protein
MKTAGKIHPVYEKVLTCSTCIAFSRSVFETQGNSCLALSGGSCADKFIKAHFNTAFYEETLESLDAYIKKWFEMILYGRQWQSREFSMVCSKLLSEDTSLVSWDDPAPEGHISVTLLLSSGPFRFIIFHCSCWWDGIEGHIHNRCYTSRGCS